MTGPRTPRALFTAAALGLIAAASGCSAADEAEAADGERGSGDYTAGDYAAEGSYTTPAGSEQIGVALTLAADGTVESLTVTSLAVNPNSRQFQAKFLSGIDEVAVGKDIATLRVDKVAGSSLSSQGFNAALDVIAEAASA